MGETMAMGWLDPKCDAAKDGTTRLATQLAASVQDDPWPMAFSTARTQVKHGGRRSWCGRWSRGTQLGQTRRSGQLADDEQ